MPIIFRCQECDARLTTPNKGAGRQVRCPGCGSIEDIPEPTKPKSRPEHRTKPKSRSEHPIEAKSRPERGRSRPVSPAPSEASVNVQKSSPLLIPGIIGGSFLLIVIVGLVAFNAGRSDKETPAPQEVAVAEKTDAAPETTPAQKTQTPPPETPLVADTVPINKPPADNALPDENRQTGFFNNRNTEPSPTPQPESFPPTNPATPIAQNPVSKSPEVQDPESESPILSVADLNEQVEPSVVRIDVISREGGANGSGYVVDASGLIATNYHVIEGGSRATVVFADGTSTPVVSLAALVPRKDIAILKIDLPSRQLKPLPLAKALPRKGEDTVAFGAPLGLSFSMSEGIVSGIRTSQELRDLKVVDVDGTWLQTTTPISPGNSGGPLVNRRGELVGMNTMTLSIGQNLNFAISSLDITEALKTKKDQPIALSPENTRPVRKSVGQGREKLIDATNTEKGQQLLSQLKQVFLLRIEVGFNDVTGNVNEFLKLQAERALERADIKLVKRRQDIVDPALMILALNFEDPENAAPGAQELELLILLVWEDTDENGQPRLYKLYEVKEKVGTFAQASLIRGIIPRRVQEGVSGVFRKYAGAFRKAQRERGK